MKTVFTFKSNDFNTSLSKDYFVNPGCFGDDVAIWFKERLQKQGINVTSKPRQEDFGWYLPVEIGKIQYIIVIGYRPGDKNTEGNWIGWIERNRGIVRALFCGRKNQVDASAIQAVHAVLSASPNIHCLLWHFRDDFDNGRENLGTPAPNELRCARQEKIDSQRQEE